MMVLEAKLSPGVFGIFFVNTKNLHANIVLKRIPTKFGNSILSDQHNGL